MSHISACLIVKNESARLGACLQSVSPWVDEICVVDTGSSDETVDIALAAGARVERFEWCDDFSAARNVSLEMATHPWILVIDADERLTAESGPALRRAVEDDAALAWLVYQDNVDAEGRVHPIGVPRLFRNRSDIRFTRPIHESVMESLQGLEFTPSPVEVHLHHIGYLPEVLAETDKYARNAALLQLQLEADPTDLFVIYKLAGSLRGDDQSARRRDLFLQGYHELMDRPAAERDEYPFRHLLVSGAVEAFAARGELRRALEVAQTYLETDASALELWFRMGEVYYALGDLQAAADALMNCFRPVAVEIYRTTDRGARTWRASNLLARIYLDAGQPEPAEKHLQRARGFRAQDIETRALTVRRLLLEGDADTAVGRLAELVKHHASHAEVRLLAGEIAWLQGERATARDLTAFAESSAAYGRGLRWQIVLDLADGLLADAAARAAAVTPDHVDLAAVQCVARVIGGQPYHAHPDFDPGIVLNRVVRTLRELVAVGADDALAAFAAHAPDYDQTLPGVGSILEPAA